MRIAPPQPQVKSIKVHQTDIPLSTQNVIQQYENIFKGVHPLQNFDLKLQINPTIMPIQQPIWHIPLHTKERKSTKLQCLLQLDIREKETEKEVREG